MSDTAKWLFGIIAGFLFTLIGILAAVLRDIWRRHIERDKEIDHRFHELESKRSELLREIEGRISKNEEGISALRLSLGVLDGLLHSTRKFLGLNGDGNKK